jgi:flavin prenyltransferase
VDGSESVREITVALTGASGSLCGQRLLSELAAHPEVRAVNAIMSAAALLVAREEIGPKDATLADMRKLFSSVPQAAGGGAAAADKVRWFEENDVGAPIASGSHLADGMAIVPCSTGTLASIATGASRNLIHRAAEVTLKERRRLILGVREAPLSSIHIENMLAATRAGAIVLPITPAFYSHPRSIEDVVQLYVGRVLDQLELAHHLGKRWGG